ncbi:MAG: dihydroorotase [Pseudomonadota bacterium]
MPNRPETGVRGRRAYLNARIVDPASGYDGPGGIVVDGVQIEAVGPNVTAESVRGIQAEDCGGHVLAPGLIDARVFTGEPGAEFRETLATASEAAAAGGVTTFLAMPDTDPVIDDIALVDFIRRRARDTAIVHIEAAAALTMGLNGKDMTEIGLLAEAGARAFTDGRHSIRNAALMRRLLTYAGNFDAVVMNHVEDPSLASEGVMNEGELASRLGLPGIPCTAETIVLERDIAITRLTGGRYHASLISCAPSRELVRKAKNDGLKVTCGVSVNHLALNENDIGNYRTFCKMAPPLRGEDDRMAMVDGIADGTIDIIVSNHDPQDVDDKRRPFAEAADGAVGVETLLPALLRLVNADVIGLNDVLAAVTHRPADLLGLPQGRLQPGAPADIILFDPEMPWVLGRGDLNSRSKNTPFDGARFEGRVLWTMVAGQKVWAYRP